jgi:hypothetical protein
MLLFYALEYWQHKNVSCEMSSMFVAFHLQKKYSMPLIICKIDDVSNTIPVMCCIGHIELGA